MTTITREHITDFANVVSFIISNFTMFALWNYYMFENIYYLELNMFAVLFQCSYDILLWHSNDSVLHHILILFTGVFLNLYSISFNDYLFLLIPFLCTEISTLFLVMKSWLEKMDLKDSGVYFVNNLLFLLSFIFTRIYIFTNCIVFNPLTYEYIQSLTETSNPLVGVIPIYIGIFGFFALNIYWLTILFKIICKPLKHVLRNYYFQLFLCTAPIVNIGICFYFYGFVVNGHVVGTLFVSWSTFLLHYSTLNYGENDAVLYAFNQVSLQVKSALFICSNLEMMFGHISVLYHFILMILTVLILLFPNRVFHMSGKILFWWMAIPLLLLGYIIFFDKISPFLHLLCAIQLTFYSTHLFSITEKELLVLPLVMDVILVIGYHIQDLDNVIYLGIVSYCMLTIIYIKPLYHHNLVLLYLMSMAQTVILCQINSS